MYTLFRHLVSERCFLECKYTENPGSIYAERLGMTLRCDARSYGICIHIRWADCGEAQMVVKEITNADIRAISQALSAELNPHARRDDFIAYVVAR